MNGLELHAPDGVVLAAGAIALVAVGAVALNLVRRRARAFGRHPVAGGVGAACAALAALGLAAAALDPRVERPARPAPSHLAVVVDVSQSVLRRDGGLDALARLVARHVEAAAQQLPEAARSRGTGSVTTVAAGSLSAWRGPLEELAGAVSRLGPRDLPPGDESLLEEGLSRAGASLSREGARGAVLLASDGHETAGDALAAARRLAASGVAVHVLPVGSRAPEVGLVALDLPAHVEAHAPTHLRGVIVNQAGRERELDLAVRREGETIVAGRGLELRTGTIRLREPVVFSRVGLRPVEVELLAADGGSGVALRQERRLWTHVTAPPRVLSVGDPGAHRLVAALPEGTWDVARVAPEELGDPEALASHDAVVLSGVSAERLPEGATARLRALVDARGAGLLLVNGPHAGEETEPTVVMSYQDTPLEPILPIVSRPRTIEPDPPPRHVVIVMDASGSMQGWKLAKEKEIAASVIARLRPKDRLDLIAFTTRALHLVDSERMTPEAQQRAWHALASVEASGGTDPSAALRLIASRRLQHCGLFFLSDGYFERIALRPDCAPTAFAIGHDEASLPAVLRELAEPFPVGPGFDPAAIRIGFFRPKPRKKRFEPGSYEPLLGIDALQQGWRALPEPPLPLFGNAVARARRDAELAAVRPRLLDVVLAFREHGAGTVGAFTTRVPDEWLRSGRGRRSLESWVSRLLGWSHRRRHAFFLEERGSALLLRVELQAEDGRLPAVDRLVARVEAPGAPGVPVTLAPRPARPGSFEGALDLAALGAGRGGEREEGVEAALVLSESGPDALARAQRVPLYLPAGGALARVPAREAWSHGVDGPALRAIAAAGGGRYDPAPGAALLASGGTTRDDLALWPHLVILSVISLVLHVALRRLAT